MMIPILITQSELDTLIYAARSHERAEELVDSIPDETFAVDLKPVEQAIIAARLEFDEQGNANDLDHIQAAWCEQIRIELKDNGRVLQDDLEYLITKVPEPRADELREVLKASQTRKTYEVVNHTKSALQFLEMYARHKQGSLSRAVYWSAKQRSPLTAEDINEILTELENSGYCVAEIVETLKGLREC